MKFRILYMLMLLMLFNTSCILTGVRSNEYKELMQKIEKLTRRSCFPNISDNKREELKEIGNNIEKYKNAVETYLSKNCREEVVPKLHIILFIVCEYNLKEDIRDELLDDIFETTEYLDAKLQAAFYHNNFMSQTGDKSIVHEKTITYCFEQLQKVDITINPSPCVLYLSRIFDSDKKTHKKFLKLLKNKKFYNSEFISKIYDICYVNKK